MELHRILDYLNEYSGAITCIITFIYVCATIIICWANIVFVKRKCEQKGPKKVSTFSTRFHVLSNAFPKYQMLTF